jgi:nucleotide-binding universal stress UspA family protein
VTIVVGYVPRPEGRAALRRAAEEARLRRMKLIVISSDKGGGRREEETLEHERELRRVRAQLEADGIEHEVRQLARGRDPSDDLIAVAEETHADSIVIGLRRRSPVGKLILGSNAQRILLDAPCPVLAVKAEEQPPMSTG